MKYVKRRAIRQKETTSVIAVGGGGGGSGGDATYNRVVRRALANDVTFRRRCGSLFGLP